MAITATPDETAAVKSDERRALGVASGAHALHDGYTDLIWLALPIWQAEFGLSYAAVGLLRTIFSGTMASLQIPATMLAGRIGTAAVLALGTALAGLCYVIAGFSSGFAILVAALFLGGLGASTQHPLASALVARAFAGTRSMTALGTYNFAGDIGKMAVPGIATLLILLMPWRPAYALLGALGLLGAAAIFFLTPRFGPEHETVATSTDATVAPAKTTRVKRGFWLLLSLAMIDSCTRAGFLVFLPFLLIGKGGGIATAGLALTLVFIGGAAGKLVCAWMSARFGAIATICISEALTAAGIIAVLLLPLEAGMVLLPLVGTVLNGTSSATYGSVPAFVSAESRSRAFSWFYTGTLGAGAIAPALSGLVGDFIGIPGAVIAVAVLTMTTIPLALLLAPRMPRGSLKS